LFLFNLFRAFNAFLSLFPASLRKQFFFSLARLAYIIDKKHRKVIGINLDIAGIEDPSQRKKIAQYCYKNLLLNLYQTIRNTQISADEANMDIELLNTKAVEEANAQNRPIIFVTAHYGNWEMLGMALVKSVDKLNIVYKKLNNDHFDQ
jgi:KDO2-lipid IV(A) lauroyltransferase